MTATLHRLRGQAPIPEAWRARAQQESCNTLAYNFMLASELTCVLNALRQAGVEGIPVKGVVLAETVYGNLALRPMADLDVLVRPSDLPAARAVLRSLGYSHRVQPLFEELHHSFHDPQYFRQASGGQICLELHWALWAAHFFDLKVEALWKRAVPAQVQGTKVRILSPEDSLLHLAIHRSRAPLRLRVICDFAQFLRRHSATLDWDAVVYRARAAGACTSMYFCLALARDLLGAPLPDGILSRLGVSQLKCRLLEYTCGATALFRPAPSDDISQQPHLTLRVFEIE